MVKKIGVEMRRHAFSLVSSGYSKKAHFEAFPSYSGRLESGISYAPRTILPAALTELMVDCSRINS